MYLENGIRNSCCGCKACASICPVGAINIEDDPEGFAYPIIDSDKCIGCRKCERVCCFNKEEINKPLYVYAAYHNKADLRNRSSSGGIFYPLACVLISQGGAVAGASYGQDFRVVHETAESLSSVSRFMRSKYVQSDLGRVYKELEEFLSDGRAVLFSGTPCQVAAIKSYFGGRYSNLYLCEVLCYGVPSPKVFTEYLRSIENKEKSRVKEINFKDKRYGWDYYTTCITLENDKQICRFGGDAYAEYYHKRLSIRPSCYSCQFGTNNSYADISLGDFYTLSEYTDMKAPKNGISCVIIRSEKGKELFDMIKKVLVYKEIDAILFSENEYRSGQQQEPKERAKFFETLNTKGFDACTVFLEQRSLRKRIKRELQSIRMRLR